MTKKIYFIDKMEVAIGDKVEIGDLTVTLTQEIIDDNPDLFEVKEGLSDTMYVKCVCNKGFTDRGFDVGDVIEVKDINDVGMLFVSDKYRYSMNGTLWKFEPSTKKEYLLQEAKKRYPIGTRFISAYRPDCTYTVSGDLQWWRDCDTDIVVGVNGASVYSQGEWAEIIKPVFTTDDGVDVFKGHKYFSTKEAAEEWLKENKTKEKTLNDYKEMLLDADGMLDGGCCANIEKYELFYALKAHYPKLYWTQVLQLIADDLNEEFDESWFNIHYCKKQSVYDVCEWSYVTHSTVKFSSRMIAEKAIEIMGDKLKYIYEC